MLPFVSVIIPAKNEEQYICSCLKSIHSQDYPTELVEIIVVDNNSTDKTCTLSKKLGAKVVTSNDTKIGIVRNKGAMMAVGKIFAYIDADCIAPKNWLNTAVTLLENKLVGAVGGYIRAPEYGNWIEKSWSLKQHETERFTKILATGSFVISQKVFKLIGGFNQYIIAGEDTDISRRIIQKGLSIKVSPKLSVIHNGYPKTVAGFLRRQIWQTSDYLHTRKQGVDPIFLATNLFLFTLLCCVVGLFFQEPLIVYIGFTINVSCPTVIGVLRLIKSAEDLSLVTTIRVITINYLYLLGRSIGLIKSYIRTTAKNFYKIN